jgi:hypothetical protein
MKLLRVLRGDPLLLALTVILTLAGWAPLFLSPFLPFSDLHNNAAAASLLWDAATHKGTVGAHFYVNAYPVPYWTGYLFMAAASAVGGVLFAAKAIVALLVVALPLSVMRLMVALGRSPRLGLWAFALFWEHNLYSGWVSFLLGMALALYTLALLVEVASLYDALLVTLLTALVALTHLQALALVAVAGIGIAILGQRIVLSAVALSGGLVAMLPWLTRHLVTGGAVTRVPWRFIFHPPSFKAAKLFTYTFDHFPAEPEVWAPAFAFAVLLVGPAAVASLVRQSGRARVDASRVDGAALWVLLSCVLLFAVLPYDIRGPVAHFHNYPRYATFILLTMLLLPRVDLRGRGALALVPGVVAALAMDLTVAAQLRRFSVNASPFLQVMAAVKPGSRVLPLLNNDADPACAYNPYNQFHAYLTAASKSYDPYLFEVDSAPLLYIPSRRIPAPTWTTAPSLVSVDVHGKLFDYVLVQGLTGDPFVPGARLGPAGVHVVAEGGIWRLYAFDRAP